jgi:hypothetical protein
VLEPSGTLRPQSAQGEGRPTGHPPLWLLLCVLRHVHMVHARESFNGGRPRVRGGDGEIRHAQTLGGRVMRVRKGPGTSGTDTRPTRARTAHVQQPSATHSHRPGRDPVGQRTSCWPARARPRKAPGAAATGDKDRRCRELLPGGVNRGGNVQRYGVETWGWYREGYAARERRQAG